jgi:hypothetical protein
MVRLEQLAEAAVQGDALLLRAMAQDWLAENPRISDCPFPATQNHDTLAVAAGLVELLALRAGQTPPAWSGAIGSVRKPIFLVKAALTMRRLREACQNESPPPLRRRGLYAPRDFLFFA